MSQQFVTLDQFLRWDQLHVDQIAASCLRKQFHETVKAAYTTFMQLSYNLQYKDFFDHDENFFRNLCRNNFVSPALKLVL